ncbi:hypothetical protein [Mesorhizobium huakuii]|uniref:Uncharacterized protein n=1 Tax=Mesorhizobium huakuii TaxID=28104 RepID=A0A7G6T0Y4_9HYPH|nr:hypothetical protein [Mesorhizobium huakuii]QND60416.1 hypothetical protein HB778_30610 [Mesorhizobium huakuii]
MKINTAVRACRVCRCTQNNACVTDGVACHWVELDLCSACVAADEGVEHGRRWLPAAWLDEMNPTMLDCPDAFIERLFAGVQGNAWALRLPAGDVERDNSFYQLAVEDGQIVEFMWTEVYGDRTLTIAPDRSWSLDSPISEKATHIFEYSTGGLADGPQELVDSDTDTGEILDPGEYVISTYAWSDPVPFRFEVDTAGAGRFAPCSGPN